MMSYIISNYVETQGTQKKDGYEQMNLLDFEKLMIGREHAPLLAAGCAV